MKQNDPADALSIGTLLGEDRSPVRALLSEARRLEMLQAGLREWKMLRSRTDVSSATSPDHGSLRVAAERDLELVIHSDSAAALTDVRYHQQELLHYLRQRFPITALKIVTKVVPRP